jgi:uncharacterized protein (TIGR02001 family)
MCPAAGLPLSRPGAAEHPVTDSVAATIARIGAIAALAAMGATAGTAFGADGLASAANYVGGSVALTSDYVYNGLSRTCGAPAAQADLHAGTSGGKGPSELYAGVWGSAGLGGDYCRQAREIDLYAGLRLALTAAQSLSLSYTHYAFPGGTYIYQQIEGRRFDYDELGATWAFEDRLFLTLTWTPNAIDYRDYGIERDRRAVSFGMQLHQPIGAGFTFSAGAGYDEVTDPSGAGYAFWNAGFGHAIGPVQLDVSYFRTSARAEQLFGPEIAGGRVAASAVWRF